MKLFYIDPPFATKSDFGGKNGERSYSDKVATAEFIEDLRERLIYQRELLDEDGSIYVHLDQKMSHYVKVMFDEVFGKNNFRNEIIWQRSNPHGHVDNKYANIHDTILFYSKSKNYIFNTQYTPADEKYINTFFKFDDGDGRKYRLVTLTAPGPGEPRYFNGELIAPPKGNHWRWSQVRIDEAMKNMLSRRTNQYTINTI